MERGTDLGPRATLLLLFGSLGDLSDLCLRSSGMNQKKRSSHGGTEKGERGAGWAVMRFSVLSVVQSS